MDLKQIKDLMSAMGRSSLKRIHIKQENFELELEKEDTLFFSKEEPSESVKYTVEDRKAKVKSPDIPTSLHPPVEHVETKELSGTFITSPMVGTFYDAPGPDEAPFIKVGDKIDKNTVVCIIEAMKVMNEVKAGVEGTVAEVLVENSHPVEFGTKLYRVT